MAVVKTQKEVLLLMSLKLDSLADSNKKIAADQFQLSCDFSSYVNKQELKNAEILGYLENNNKTNQKGLVEQVKVNVFDINEIKKGNQIDKAKVYGAGAVIALFFNFIFKYFFK